MINKFVSSIMESVDHSEESVALTAVQCLESLSSLYSKLAALDKVYLHSLIDM
jgi:hypothetical protein